MLVPDLSPEDRVIAQELAECSSRPYAELIRSDIPGPSGLRFTHFAVLRPSPPSTMKVAPVGPSAIRLTKGELLARVKTLSRKSRSVKWKTSTSVKEDRPSWGKVPKLAALHSSPSTDAPASGQVQSPPAEIPTTLDLPPRPGSTAEAKDSPRRTTEQPLEIVPISVWNPPPQSVEPPPPRAEELKRKGFETEGDDDSLLLNAELAAGAISSILKDSDLKRSGALPVEEVLGLSLQGVAAVSSHILSCLTLTYVGC